ncbi:MAG TPA: hypothetical protein DEB40_11535 [Elusimicrobia bacterium]|nr:hypothetical protein [Elusimicrobiota bacterium]HBT62365.1 hypothetical protein [Elusimicrobiota bacterium]
MIIRRSRGVTLTELMVAVSLLSVGILAFFGAFNYITKSIQISRARTLAANLAQEKVESLKNSTYYQLLITTDVTTDNSFSPALIYDDVNYPPESINIGGMIFDRYTFVSLAQIDNNVISTVTYTFPDTGMKQITVTVAWTQGGERKRWSLSNLLENPFVNPLDASFSGTISSAVTGTPIAGALVRIQENPDWNAVTDGDGKYSFRVYHGSYTIQASSAGWYPASSSVQSAPTGSNVTVDMQLTQIASGSIAGIAWLNPNLLISQVVISTPQAQQNGFVVQYVELYNPTTSAITIGGDPPPVKLKMNSTCSGNTRCDDATYGIKLDYVRSSVPAYGYYLIANTNTFSVAGVLVTADAVFADDADNYCAGHPVRWNLGASPVEKQIFNSSHNACVQLENLAGDTVDTVGWSHGGISPPNCGTFIDLNAFGGLHWGSQLVRVSSPAASDHDIDAYGRAYDSGENTKDFIYPSIAGHDTILLPPYSATSSTKPPISGKPAIAAYIDANDPLSGSTQTYIAYIDSGSLSLPYAAFRLNGVSTGVWTVEIASSSWFREITGATVTARGLTFVPNSTTTPSWTVADHVGVSLDSSSLNGFVSGTVTNISGRPIPAITVKIGSTPKTTGPNGTYFTSVSSGPVSVVANPGNADPAYMQAIAMPTVETGQITLQDFTLSQGGVVRGFVTAGTTPLPNIVVTANIGGNQYGAGTSGATGMFNIKNLSTGTFTIRPALEIGQDSTPDSRTAIVTSANTIDIGTFTISGAFGVITGRVNSSVDGSNITTGALIVAATSDPPNPPWSVCGSSAPALTPFYTASSRADGTYVMSVRGGTSYYLRIYYPIVDLKTGVLSLQQKSYSGVSVGVSSATTQDLVVP